MSALQHAFWDEACAEALSDARLLAAMARFEGALAKASVARRASFPPMRQPTIAKVAAQATFDAAALGDAARRSATLAIPFVKSLTEQVAAVSADAARYVHFGATSQDVVDTGVVLCLGAGVPSACLPLSKRVGDAAAALAQRHATTPMVARTLLQPAVPVSVRLEGRGLAVRNAAHARARLFRGGARMPASCSSAARAARCRPTARRATRSPTRSPPNSASRARRSPGTACATALRGSAPKPRSSRAPRARSRATSRC